MSMRKLFVILFVFMFLTGCMAKNFTTKDMVMHSSGVNYAYDLGKDELIIYVSKSKYQFIPDALAVIEECKSHLCRCSRPDGIMGTRQLSWIVHQILSQSNEW